MSLLGESRPELPTENGGQGMSSTLGLVTLATPKHIKEVALTRATVHVLLEIEAASLTPVREGLDLVAVLDVSGSMADDDDKIGGGGGQKLSKMKNAMTFLISKLAPMDRLSIVTFASKEEKRCGLRAMKADVKPALHDIVAGLDANGGTNISAGLKTALDIIKGRKYTQGRTGNIFFLSDGRQTNGDAKLLDAGDVPVYTFGIGKDADCELLSAIARNSRGGTFSTVKHGDELTKPFANLLGGAVTVVAQDVELTLAPFLDDKNPLRLEKMEVVAGVGYYNADQVDMDTGTITIRFGNLFREERRKVVVKMTLRDGTKPPAVAVIRDEEDHQDQDAAAAAPAANAKLVVFHGTFLKLALASLTYTAQGKQSSNGQADKLITIIRTPTPTFTAGDAAVLTELARLQHAALISEARLLANQKKLGEAKDKLMDALNNVENVVADDGGKMANMLRREVLHLLGLMKKTQELYESEGRPYALACESSHGFQRYAGRGDGDGIRTFCTTRMDTYHQQAADFLDDTTKLPPTAEEDVKVEVAANPIAAFSPEIASYIRNS